MASPIYGSFAESLAADRQRTLIASARSARLARSAWMGQSFPPRRPSIRQWTVRQWTAVRGLFARPRTRSDMCCSSA